MIVQIYEIQCPEEAEKCIELGVDHVGSVLLSETDWRQPELKETIRMSKGTSVKNSIIALFQEFDTLCKALDYYQPHYIHFCQSLVDNQGKEIDLSPFVLLQSKIRERYPEVGIIRSIPVPRRGAEQDFPLFYIAEKLEPLSDLFLTDTWLGKEPVEGFIGITGKTCDWNMAKEVVLKSKIPILLAGGLSPENVYHALLEVAPAGADSCTHTNKVHKDGRPIRFKKDFGKVKRFVDETRRAEKDVARGGSVCV